MADADWLIEVDQLTRRFPRCEALGGISFRVRRGEIAALLGPNGSGKTTTLRILSGFLAPSSGRVRVAGCDLQTHPLDARRRIGYLPESAPLPLDMRVAEYLAFRGRLRGLRGRHLTVRLREVADRCGLGDVWRRRLGSLSRGFRQRTGLADCLLHEPDVLLLDEPLAGLDPAQVQAVQEWLKEAGRQGAVLFSTHVLSEVEPLCQQALILNAGRLAAADSPGRIARASARLRAELFAPADRLAAALEALPGASDIRLQPIADGWTDVGFHSGPEELSGSLEDLAAVHHWPIRCVRRESRTFAEAYLRLTSALPIVKNPAQRRAS